MKSHCFRFESAGESGIPFPTLGSAMGHAPSHHESQIRTSIEGIVLAEAEEVCGPGSMLRWVVTLAGQDVVDRTGWAGQMTDRDHSTVLMVALAEDLRVAS